jgi:hypothetical protein
MCSNDMRNTYIKKPVISYLIESYATFYRQNKVHEISQN